jgi:hypothetical protein
MADVSDHPISNRHLDLFKSVDCIPEALVAGKRVDTGGSPETENWTNRDTEQDLPDLTSIKLDHTSVTRTTSPAGPDKHPLSTVIVIEGRKATGFIDACKDLFVTTIATQGEESTGYVYADNTTFVTTIINDSKGTAHDVL